MSQHDLYLLAIALIVILAVVIAIARLRVHPFPALVIGALVLGLWAGASPDQVLKSFRTGFGETLANVGVLLALGAMFGELLASSGGAERVSSALLKIGGPRLVPWTMGAVAMILGLPLFFEAGVVLMMPIIILGVSAHGSGSGAERQSLSTGGTAGVLPAFGAACVGAAHPGPMVAIGAESRSGNHPDRWAFLISLPIAGGGGTVYTFDRAAPAPPPWTWWRSDRRRRSYRAAGIGVTIFTISSIVDAGRAAAELVLPGSRRARAFDFIGNPLVALLLAVILSMFTFGFALGKDTGTVGKLLGDALPPVAAIMLIIGAGGALKQMLIDVGLGTTIAHASQLVNFSPLLLGWFTAVIIRLATGSATVATVTAAGLMAATVGVNPGLNPALLALSIGSGSLFFSHINDAGFWLVKEYMGMNLPNMFKTWSLMETIIAVMGLFLSLGLSLVI